jgi:hypothetical protein
MVEISYRFSVTTNSQGCAMVVIQPNYLVSQTTARCLNPELRVVQAFYTNDEKLTPLYQGTFKYVPIMNEGAVTIDFDSYECIKSVLSLINRKPKEKGEVVDDDNVEQEHILVQKINARMVPHIIHKSHEDYQYKILNYLNASKIKNKVEYNVLFDARYNFDCRINNEYLDKIHYNNDALCFNQPPIFVFKKGQTDIALEDVISDELKTYDDWLDQDDIEIDENQILGYNRAFNVIQKFAITKDYQPQQYNTIARPQDYVIVIKINGQAKTKYEFNMNSVFNLLSTTVTAFSSSNGKDNKKGVLTSNDANVYKVMQQFAKPFIGVPTSQLVEGFRQLNLRLEQSNGKLESLKLEGFLDWIREKVSTVADVVGSGMKAIGWDTAGDAVKGIGTLIKP